MARTNDKFKFTAAGWTHLGTCVIASVKIGRVWANWELTCLEGANKGKNFTAKTRLSGKGLEQYGEVVGKAPAAAEKAREVKYERETKKYEAASAASKTFEAGDLATISVDGKDSWTMKVLEVDYKAGKIKGVNANTRNPGSTMAWASLTHPKVKVTLKQKAAFDPSTDPTVAQFKIKAQTTAAKRTATRRRNSELKDIFGLY